MSVDTGPALRHDHELDVPSSVVERIPAASVREHQRLVVNPLLMVLGCLVAGFLLRHALGTRNLMLFLAAIGLMAASLPLFQFHCLDCGQTGWYHRARRHVCQAVLGRYRRRELAGGRFSARTQLFIWLYAMITVIIVASIFALGRL